MISEETFEALCNGDERALTSYYRDNYGYVVGFLVYRHAADRTEADDCYTDAVLKLRDKAMQGALVFGNLRAYLLKTAIMLLAERRRGARSLLRRHEAFLSEQPNDGDDTDPLIGQEDARSTEQTARREAHAMQAALATLDETCRQLLTDTILLGLKVGELAEKFGLKNPRVVTDKKIKCKEKLRTLILTELSHKS